MAESFLPPLCGGIKGGSCPPSRVKSSQPGRNRENLSYCFILGCILLCAFCVSVAAADSLQVPDTTVLKEELPLWSDSTLALPDSVPQSAGLAERWLIPLGVILVSGAVAVALFAVRSR